MGILLLLVFSSLSKFCVKCDSVFEKFDLFHSKRSCYCEVLEGYREPCGEHGGDLDKLTCHKYGCCYIEPLSEEAPRCFLRKKSCVNRCSVEKRLRSPCLSWMASKSACENKGCCFDRRTFPSCYYAQEDILKTLFTRVRQCKL